MNIMMTGCSRSVGAYIRESLINQGHQVYGVGMGGPNWEQDFSSPENLLANVVPIFEDAEQYFAGCTDILINNAAVTQIDFMEEHSFADWNRVMAVNVTAPFLLTQEFVRRVIIEELNDKHHGDTSVEYRRVISTSSMGTKTSLRASPGYCASKAGIEALTKMWAREFSNKLPIITCAIAPAGIDDTAMKQQCIDDLQRTRGMSEQEAIKYFTQAPLGRNCSFEEVWSLFDFAVNKMPVYCSGEVFYMTGGTGL